MMCLSVVAQNAMSEKNLNTQRVSQTIVSAFVVLLAWN